MVVARTIPVVEFGGCSVVVDVAQIQEHIGVPACDHIFHRDGVWLTAGAIPGRGQYEGPAWLRCCPGCRCVGISVDRRLGNPIIEYHVDHTTPGNKTVTHMHFRFQESGTIYEFSRGD